MGTVKKLAIASTVAAMMAMMFAVGLMPSPGALGVFAASGDGPKDVRDILSDILGLGDDGTKGVATGVTIGQPGDAATVRVRQNSPTAVLPVHATLEPIGTEGTVRVGIEGTVNPSTMEWNGDVASPDNAIQSGEGISVTSINVAPLGTTALATTSVRMYGLGMETAKQFGAVTVSYTVLDQIDFDIEIVDSLMNPFTDLGDGEVYVADELDLAGGGRLYTVFADLDVTGGLLPTAAKGGLDGRTDLNGVVTIPVEIGAGPNGPRVIVQSVSLADLQAAFPASIGVNEEAVLVVRVATTADGLVGAVQAADLADTPTSLAAGAQLVQIAIVYTTDNGAGATFAEVEELSGLDIPVVLTFENLPATKQLSLARGVAFYGHDSIIDFAPDPDEFIQVPSDPGATWQKRFGSVLDPFNQVLTIDLNYLSIFAPFDSILEIDSLYPSAGGFPGGDSITIAGSFETQDGVNDEDAYIVFFGDPMGAGTQGTVTGATSSSGVITEIVVDTPAMTAGDDDVIVDVTVQDASTPSDFVTALQAFTYTAAPILDAIMPNFGPLSPTAAVRLSGLHLAGLDAATKVYFGMYAVQSSGFSGADPAGMFIDVVPPAIAADSTLTTVDVAIMTALGMYTVTDGFTYYPLPVIDTIDPNFGPLVAASAVYISGMNFAGVDRVYFGGVEAALAKGVISSDTEIVVTPPDMTVAGLVDVAVGNPAETAIATDGYRYVGPPAVTDITPLFGGISGGDSIDIVGDQFFGVTAVSLGGAAQPTFVVDPSGTTITVTTVGVGAPQSGPAVVTTDFGMADSGTLEFTYVDTPVIDSFDPMTGLDDGGTTVIVMGSSFFGTLSVEVAGVAATVDAVNGAGTQLTITTGAAPAGTAPGPITVTNENGTATSAEDFRYLFDPVITTFDPMSGPAGGGQTVTITGQNLVDITTLTVAGVALTDIANDITDVSPGGAPNTVIEIVTPPGTAGTEGPIFIATLGGAVSSTDDYRYEFDSPVVDDFTPAFGSTAGGTVVTITGGGFNNISGVSIAGVPAASFTVVSATEISATTAAVTVLPGALAPQGFVEVSNPDTTGQSLGAFRYIAPPVISSFTPVTGDVLGGDLITVTGEHLNPLDLTDIQIAGFTVNLGSAGDVSPVGAPFTLLEFTTPMGAPGASGPVVITNLVADSATSAADFTYELRAPLVTDFTPLTGPTAGGTSVTITGAGFTGATDVTIAGISAASFTVDSDTQVTAITDSVTVASGAMPPEGPVTVANAMGVSNDSAEDFRYVAPPVVGAFTPITGPGDGGTAVNITGEHLRDITSITVAGVTVTDPVMNVADPFTSIDIVTAMAPFGTPPGPIEITTIGGTGTSAENYTYEFNIPDLTVDTLSPNDAWIFGGVVTEISGTGFVDPDVNPAFQYNVLFGTEAATVLGVSGTGGLLVQVPPAAGVNDASVLMEQVTVSVERVINGNSNPVDPVEAAAQFTYSRIAEDGGEVTTTAVLSGGVGSMDIALDATGSMNAAFSVPANTGADSGITSDVFVIARAATATDSFGTAPDVAANGTNVADSYTYFDIHFYRAGPALADPQAGDFALEEVSDGFQFGEGDEAAMLSTTVGSTNIPANSVQTGRVVVFQDATSATGAPRTLSFPNPTGMPSLAAGSVERYQSTVLSGEFTLDATDSSVEAFNNLRISDLGTIVVRDSVVLDFDALGINPFLASAAMSELGDQVPVRIESTRGGLGFIDRIEIIEVETGATKVIPRTQLANLASSNGENEFLVTAMMPVVGEPGTVNIDVFLPSGASFTLPQAFEFTGQPGNVLTGILLALAIVVGLAAAGGDGGGGGGPCFIATAAYGTPVAAEIEVLRDVRDSYLLDNAVGAAFVDLYYTVSPAIADVVAQSPALAALVRLALTPVIFFGKIVLTAPMASVAIALMAMALAMARRMRARRVES